MNSLSRLALLAALALPATLLAGCFVDSNIGGAPCKPGEKKTEDCNTCVCQANGQFQCTTEGCPAGGSSGSAGTSSTGCQSNADCPQGKDICQTSVCQAGTCVSKTTGKCPTSCEPGQVIDAGDGCNKCTCQTDHTFACTELGCAPACTTSADCPQPDDPCTSYQCENRHLPEPQVSELQHHVRVRLRLPHDLPEVQRR